MLCDKNIMPHEFKLRQYEQKQPHVHNKLLQRCQLLVLKQLLKSQSERDSSVNYGGLGILVAYLLITTEILKQCEIWHYCMH